MIIWVDAQSSTIGLTPSIPNSSEEVPGWPFASVTCGFSVESSLLAPSLGKNCPMPFCHLGDGHHLTGFPPLFLFLPPPELFGEPTDDDEAQNCLRGALAPTAFLPALSA